MGLCRFYHTGAKKSNVLTGPKSADCACKIQGLVEMAKGVRWVLTIVAFEGELFSPVCLLQELHSHLTLSHIAIHTPDEAKVGVRNRMYCCPICTYVAKSNIVFLNHVIVGHYWGSFSCGKCLASVAATAQKMRRHFANCGKPQVEHSKACSMQQQSASRLQAQPQVQEDQEENQGRGRARQHGRGRAVHQQSPFQRSPSRSRLRSTRSQCPEFSPTCINSIRYAIMSGRVRHMLWRLRRC